MRIGFTKFCIHIYFCSVGCTLLVEERSKESSAQNLLPRVSIRGDCELRHRQCVWKQKWSLKWFSINFSVLSNDSSACVCVCVWQVVVNINKLSGGIYFRRAGPREKVLYLSLSVCAPVLSVPLAGIVALPRSANWIHKEKGPSFQDFLISGREQLASEVHGRCVWNERKSNVRNKPNPHTFFVTSHMGANLETVSSRKFT